MVFKSGSAPSAPVDIEEELMAHDTDLTRRAARYIRIKRQTELGLRAQLHRCNELLNARDLSRASAETSAAQPCRFCKSTEHQEQCDSPGAIVTGTTGCPKHDSQIRVASSTL